MAGVFPAGGSAGMAGRTGIGDGVTVGADAGGMGLGAGADVVAADGG